MHIDRSMFQLYLLSTMRAKAEVTQALSALGASSVELARANDGVRRLLGSVPQADAFVRILGDPDRQTVKGTSRLLRFNLPVWPNLEFALDSSLDGYVERAEFVRGVGAVTPSLRGASDLRAWAYVSEEVSERFGKPRLEDGWSEYRDFLYQVPSPGARPSIYRLCFDFNLLQTFESTETRAGP